jgi:hypothetical protein
MKNSRIVGTAVLGACLLGAAPAPLLACVSAEGLDAFGGPFRAVEITIDPWREGQEPVAVTTDDPALLDGLATVLLRAEAGKDHKCRDVGTLRITAMDRTEMRLGILPGHDARYYQLRLYSGDRYAVFRVERETFLDAIDRIGVPVRDAGFPK